MVDECGLGLSLPLERRGKRVAVVGRGRCTSKVGEGGHEVVEGPLLSSHRTRTRVAWPADHKGCSEEHE